MDAKGRIFNKTDKSHKVWPQIQHKFHRLPPPRVEPIYLPYESCEGWELKRLFSPAAETAPRKYAEATLAPAALFYFLERKKRRG